jgi:hypothetical protein
MMKAKLASEHSNFMGSADYEEGMTGSRSSTSISQKLAGRIMVSQSNSPDLDLSRTTSTSTPSSTQGATLSPLVERVPSGSPDMTPSKKRDLLRAKMAAGQIEMMGSGDHDDEMSAGHSRHTSIADSLRGSTSSHGDK